MKLTKKIKVKRYGHLKLKNPLFWRRLCGIEDTYTPYHQLKESVIMDRIKRLRRKILLNSMYGKIGEQ